MNKTILSVALAACCTASLSIQASAPELETLVVVASRSETPLRSVGSSVAVLDETAINARGFASLADVLRSLPSVAVTNSGGPGKVSALRMRGEAGFRTLVLVDGVDVTDPTGPQASSQVQHLLSANVTRVELLRGPQGMMYGADAGGVVHISTEREGEGLYGGASGEAGRYNSRNLAGHLGGGDRTGDYYLSAARASTDGFNAHVEDESGEPDGYQNTTLHGRAGWNIGPSLRLQGVVRDTDAETEFDRCGWPPMDDCLEAFSQRNLRGSLTHHTEAREHTLAYSDTDVRRDLFEAGTLAFQYAGEIQRWELRGRTELSAAHQLVYGLEDRTDRARSFDPEVADQQRGQQSGYLEYQGRYRERFFLTAGVRRDDNDDFGSNTSYRLSGAYLLPVTGGNIKFRSSLGTGFRAPSLFEVSFNRAQNNPDLRPLDQEDSRGLDLAVEYFGDRGLHLEAVLFDQRIDNEIFFDMVAFSGYLQDGQSSQSRGLELVANVPVGSVLAVSANYTYTDAETDAGAPRPRQPKHLANLGLSYTPIERLTLNTHVRAARDIVEAGSGEALDNYQVVDASVRYRVLEGTVLYLRGENVFDADYQEVAGFNTGGAAAYAGVEFRF